jgi:hypothetical protein
MKKSVVYLFLILIIILLIITLICTYFLNNKKEGLGMIDLDNHFVIFNNNIKSLEKYIKTPSSPYSSDKKLQKLLDKINIYLIDPNDIIGNYTSLIIAVQDLYHYVLNTYNNDLELMNIINNLRIDVYNMNITIKDIVTNSTNLLGNFINLIQNSSDINSSEIISNMQNSDIFLNVQKKIQNSPNINSDMKNIIGIP